MKIKRQATIRDVAAAANVSTATVSKFINGLQRFSPQVEEKLRKVIDELGYQQNPAARSMVTGKTGAIGLAVLDICNPYFTNIIKGANRVALANGYSLLVIDLEENPSREHQLLDALSRRVDGLIVHARIPEDTIEWLVNMSKPMVFVGKLSQTNVPSVRTNGYQASRLIGKHLAETGRKNIAYVGYSAANWHEDRLKGLVDSLAEYGIAPRVYDIEDPVLGAGQAIAESIFFDKNRPDAIIGCNDLVALGIMHEAHAHGIKVPEDISIAGYDDIPVAQYVYPTLTTVDMKCRDLGETAMRHLLSKIANPNELSQAAVLEPEIIIRNSTTIAKS